MPPHLEPSRFKGIRRGKLLRAGVDIAHPLALQFIATGTIEGMPPPRNCYDGATLAECVRRVQHDQRQQAHELEHHTLYPAMEERARNEGAGGLGTPLPDWHREQLEAEARGALRQAEARHALLPRTPAPPLCECGRPDLRAVLEADAAREAEAATMTPDEREAMNDARAPLLRVLASEVGQQHILPRLASLLPRWQQLQETLRALRRVCRKACVAVNNYVTRLELPAVSPEVWSTVAKFSTPAAAGGRSLQSLTINSWPAATAFSQDDAAALAGLAAPGLQMLRIRSCHLFAKFPWEPGAVRTLVQRAHWPALEKLIITANALSVQDVVTLSQGQWPQLRVLDFVGSGPALGVEGAAALARAPWPLLQELHVSHPGITAEGAAAIATAQWPGLRSLTLYRGCMGDRGARALTGATWPALYLLCVRRNRVGEEGRAALRARWPEAMVYTE